MQQFAPFMVVSKVDEESQVVCPNAYMIEGHGEKYFCST
jgi:hypothetical protein